MASALGQPWLLWVTDGSPDHLCGQCQSAFLHSSSRTTSATVWEGTVSHSVGNETISFEALWYLVGKSSAISIYCHVIFNILFGFLI